MKGKKTLLHSVFITCMMLLTAAMFFSSVAFSIAQALTMHIDDDSYFTGFDVNGHKFKCYDLTGEDDEGNPLVDCVAIAWLNDPNDDLTGDIVIQPTVTLDDDDDDPTNNRVVDVKAIAKGGFRHAPFTTVTIPQSVNEIREEAFAYCENLVEFTFPHNIDKIAPSTFMDCQKLETVYFTDSTGTKVLANGSITEIGNHAFDNCVSLRGFYCPSTVTRFGKSCFQNCKTMVNFYFPSWNENHDNYITVDSFAFTDCKALETVYFETNMQMIDDYAFVGCKTTLEFLYTGDDEPDYNGLWRRKYITTDRTDIYDLHNNNQEIKQDPKYPGLIYTIETDAVPLDSARGQDTINVIEAQEASSGYIAIYKFDTPFATQAGYWNKTNGVLEIPDEIEGLKVKVIKAGTFANNTAIKHVIFNESLVQIQHQALFECNQIEHLTFTRCKKLKEISYEIFNKLYRDETKKTDTEKDCLGPTAQKYNEVLHEIVLPSCLEYLGDFAFYNFLALTKVEFLMDHDDETGEDSANIKLIGDYAFAVYAKNDSQIKNYTPAGLMEVILPNSLNDKYSPIANYKHTVNPWSNATKQRYAVGRYVFDNQRALASVKMQKATAAQKLDSTHTTSFASNVFVRCINLMRFESNYNLLLIGNDCFKEHVSLKEVFLHTEKAQATNYSLPWGINDDNDSYKETPFSGTKSKPDTIIYLSGSKAPKNLDNPSKYGGGVNLWNSDKSVTFANALGYDNSAGSAYARTRSHIPTYYNVNWEDEGSINISYWNPYTSTTKAFPLSTASGSVDYDLGYISVLKYPNTTDANINYDYTIAKYFTDGAKDHYADEIDLTLIPDAGKNITNIGATAFATEKKKMGYYFILPDTVKTIEERAFFHSTSVANPGVRIVTYKDSTNKDKIALPANAETKTYEQYRDNSYIAADSGYLCLPSSTTRIEADAFYNNFFGSITLGANTAYLGVSAFVRYSTLSKITDVFFTPGTGNKFSCSTDGSIYYSEADNARKTLVYTPGGNEDTLTIEDNTLAIANSAAAKSNIKHLVLNDGLTTIYGSAFQYSTELLDVTGDGLKTVKYINARTANSADEVWQSNLPFENKDSRWYGGSSDDNLKGSSTGAFYRCEELTTFDFTKMSALEKIGVGAFGYDYKLANMTDGTKTYNFYTGTPANPTRYFSDDTTGFNAGVLDLSDRTKNPNLNTIARKAFENCSSIRVAILPNTTSDNHYSESNFSFGIDAKDNGKGQVFNKTTVILVGETYAQASITDGYSVLKYSNHYPQDSLKNNSETYYRWYYNENPEGTVTNDKGTFDVTTSGSNEDIVKYWTIYNGDYYLFVGRKQVKAFYNYIQSL